MRPPHDESDSSLRREQAAWKWYDWATSGFYTTVLVVLFAPLMISVAGKAAGCGDEAEGTCQETVSVLGLDLAAGSLPSYLIAFATIVSAFLLPFVGALVDRTGHKRLHLAWFGWSGAFFCGLLFFTQGDRWQLGAVAIVCSIILGACSLVSYFAVLVDITSESERHEVALHGSALGFLGGGILLVINLVMVLGHDAFRITEELAVRLSLLSAAIWWAVFMLIPVVRLRSRPAALPATDHRLRGTGRRLASTLRDMRSYPMARLFLLAYLFFANALQTVVFSASIYATKQLHLGQGALIISVLIIQFVAFGAALGAARLTRLVGAHRCLVYGMVGWLMVMPVVALLPERNVPLYLLAAAAIAVVMGATIALSRSVFSLLIPHGKEGEYFGVYATVDRGTSWIGVVLFGLVFQLTGSYRPAIVPIIVFFALGLVTLLAVDVRRGARDAGNQVD